MVLHGGSDMVAIIVRAFKKQVKTGTLIVIIDALIVVASTIYFKQIEVGLYSALAIYVLGKILDVFFEGINFSKTLYIISDKNKICCFIIIIV